MAAETKKDGINCLIVNSEVKEMEVDTNKQLDALVEVNLPTDRMLHLLNTIYEGWEVINQIVKPLEFHIKRNDKSVLLSTNAITLVVRKKC